MSIIFLIISAKYCLSVGVLQYSARYALNSASSLDPIFIFNANLTTLSISRDLGMY